MSQLLTFNERLRSNGHYSPAVAHAGMVYVSATLPTSAQSSCDQLPYAKHALVTASVGAQMFQLLANCSDILQASGSSLDRVLSLTVYVTDIDHWEVVDHYVAEFFAKHRPARSVICVPQIRYGYAVQASLIASI